jgi:hypothetical protein
MRLRYAIILVVGVSFGGGVWVLCKRAPSLYTPWCIRIGGLQIGGYVYYFSRA